MAAQSGHKSDIVRIGCYSAFWGDSPQAAHQLANLPDPPLDYLVADYLAEVTIGLLARRSRLAAAAASRKGNTRPPQPGYIEEILPLVISPLLATLQDNGSKLVINAGGLDPLGLKSLIEKEVQKQGLDEGENPHRVAAVWGDDLYEGWEGLVSSKAFSGFSPLNASSGPSVEPLLSATKPQGKTKASTLLSLNAYIGARPIADALARGATIVVTGRVVDSALVLGPLMHEFGWTPAKNSQQGYLDRLATASLAGHIIECGAQATGGNFTDWRQGAFSAHGGWSNMGYGIVEFPREKDGLEFDVTKPPETGGVVSPLSVGEQMLYEVLDPSNYILPDVVLDLSNVKLSQAGEHIVRVTGAIGRPPPRHLKCTAILPRGYKIAGKLAIIGEEAKLKAEVLGRAILGRARRVMQMRGFDDFTETRIEVVGSETMFGSHGRMDHSREVYLRLSASHADSKALFWVALEMAQAATSTAPAITGSGSGRVRPSPLFSTTSVLIQRDLVRCKTLVGSETSPSEYVHPLDGSIAYSASALAPPPSTSAPPPISAALPSSPFSGQIPSGREAHSLSHIHVPLIRLAVGRSGDKGDTANVAFLARKPEYFSILKSQVTTDVVRAYLAHLLTSPDENGMGGSEVQRYEVPGVCAINFVVTKCLGGGGLMGLQLDRQAKSFAQIGLSAIKVRVPVGLISSL